MIVHNFVCDNCNKVIQDTVTTGIHKCPVCGSDMRWDLNIAIHGNYSKPIHSDALAINPDQVEEHKKKFPNIELDSQCRPIFDNYVRHRNYLKATGFTKLRQKQRPKGKRIA